MTFFHDVFAADAPATAATTAPAADETPYQLSPEKMMTDNLLILGLLFFIFYFILIRPQQKRVKMHREMLKSIAKGQKIITSGGLIGSIIKVEGDVAIVEIAQNVRVSIATSAISEVVDGKASSANDN